MAVLVGCAVCCETAFPDGVDHAAPTIVAIVGDIVVAAAAVVPTVPAAMEAATAAAMEMHAEVYAAPHESRGMTGTLVSGAALGRRYVL